MHPEIDLDADTLRRKKDVERQRAWRIANPEKYKAKNDRANRRRVEKDPDFHAKVRAKRLAADPDYYKKAVRRYKLKNPEKRMLWAARTRAKAKNIPFSITEDDIHIPDVCPVFGIKLVLNSGLYKDDSPSLDRINPVLGYVPGNVVVISLRANRIKNNATVEEIALLNVWLSSHHSKSGIH